MRHSEASRVLYDITVLGLGYHKSSAQTGIFRVIEALALALAQRSDVALTLCAREHQFHAQSYAQADKTLAALPMQFVPSHVASSRARFQATVRMEPLSGLPRTALRVWRKMLEIAERAAKVSEHPLPARGMADADIYHATFYPAPQQVRSDPRLRVFQTVYDLIALDQPQFFTPSVVANVRAITDSLTPEAWVFCISDATRQDLCRHVPALDPARVLVTPLAADPARFYPATDPAEIARVREHYAIPEGRYLLSVCTLEPRKNLAHVVRSFVRLQQEHPDPELRLVLAGGKGWHFDEIFREVAGAAAFQSQIIVTGYVADDDLACLYSGAECFVYMSLYEGFGLPPLEAMQCGVPVIASNTSSLPEVVGQAGILLAPTDGDALCQALLNVTGDDDLRARMSAQSLARASEFSWQRCAQATADGYAACRS